MRSVAPDMAPDMAGAIATQQQALRTLYRRHVRAGQPYALLDFPDHARNVRRD